ncbi:tol [Fusarium agapanthi]|uniref:Tol n=1 Tax=Fusarium agapanthi TaxID=1803897 RepID=A0A9P5AZL1_9HYPO|nr:tol [Fusarium agapanthi]
MTSSSELLTWYYRVSEAVKRRNSVILWDFDEDISDLDEANPDETVTYNAPDAADYHRLRKKLEERKRELFQRKETIRKRKEDAGEEEKNKIEQVRAAYEALEISVSRSESTRLGPIDSQFDLYCMDYFDLFYDPIPHGYHRRYIRFEYQDRGEAHSDNLTGRFWFNAKVDFELVPFKAPDSSSLERHEIYTTDGRFSMIIQFIDKYHLILRASRDLVFWGALQDLRGPETFMFMGVRNDLQIANHVDSNLSIQWSCAACDISLGPIRTRGLSDLTQSSRHCKLCAMWLRALEHSRRNLRVRGQVAALRQHPLEQGIDDVTLVFLSSKERPQIVWPHSGHVWASLDTVDIDDAKDINWKPLPASDQAESTWKSVREWLDRCEKHHRDCKHKKMPAWKPTRLLYVCNTQAALQVRLVESQDIPDVAEYLTLSHCTGAGSTLQLTRSNIEAFKSSIPVDELSRVFVDPCNTTKRLSYEYLWINALCIVQDDPADWQHEVGCMASTYSNSWLNLSADGNDAAEHGLFCPASKRADRPWFPEYIHREWGEGFPRNYCISDYHNWWERISDSKLNRGAWAFQEHVLAPKFVLDARNKGLARLTPENSLRNWNQIVRAYSQGQLTVATDKLVALSSLIDVLHPVFRHMMESEVQVENGQGRHDAQTRVNSHCQRSSGLFLAGLWRPYVERQLAWRAMSRKYLFEYDENSASAPGKRYDKCIAPIWSWCSVKDAIIEPQEARFVDIYITKVIGTNIVPHGRLDPATPSSGLGYCSSPGSFLRLRCSYLPIVELGSVSGMKLVDFGAATRERGMGGEVIEVQSKNYWDVEFTQEAIDCKPPIAVPVFANMAYFTNPVHCLVLDEREDENGNRWHIRVGAFVITHPEDVQKFWKGIEDFDQRIPEDCERYDGLYRFKELESSKSTYVKTVEVLQRVVEIR